MVRKLFSLKSKLNLQCCSSCYDLNSFDFLDCPFLCSLLKAFWCTPAHLHSSEIGKEKDYHGIRGRGLLFLLSSRLQWTWEKDAVAAHFRLWSFSTSHFGCEKRAKQGCLVPSCDSDCWLEPDFCLRSSLQKNVAAASWRLVFLS